ncbi:restriction endonuclease subunit S [Streptococcus suis]|uniref:Restriction endonuclease subunit S n=1 Tax=Streptococcus suis TaxID=1307 RepID=A0A7T1P6T7_STRSU|nr:restriction endonuclease subunit S [Streptococcus suis]MCQ8272372.1 restriction endonuclease subunit S [Streptococcus suis]MCQ8785730.1 restriction endonuclease subunit S [Streptococcus suis]MDY7599525.1 restriction endonuclease subunit S [Streptococcus suis]NRG75441.1 restriction endonuclease subunit S [Streptococcus suis]QPO26775.1 restriction endonuclease subunit S [Streptococcus suis]
MTRMKDSGIEWIGEVPEEWGIKPIKHIFGAIGSGTTPDSSKVEYYDGNINWLQSGDLYKKDYVYVVSKTITDLGYRSSASLRIYQAPFLAIAMYGASIGNLAIIKIDACVNQAVAVLKGEENIVRFAKLALEISKTELIFAAQGGTQPNINQVLIKNWVIPFPSEIEIKKIADFLDKKVAQLDKVKSLLEEQIKTLEDYRQSLIYETVTKGLDKTVPLKDSGVDWIGQIPEGWEITRLKYICGMQSGNNLTSLEISSENDGGKIFPVYGGNGQRGYYNDFTNEGNYCLVGRQGALAGNVHFVSGKFWATDHAIVVYEHTHTYSKYVYYLLKVMNLNQYAFETSAQPGLSVEKILQLETIHCPKGEQTQIADFLDKKTEQINQMIAIKKEQIENINKQRQTLIYDYVTGKRRV